jgi:hypothetical protein
VAVVNLVPVGHEMTASTYVLALPIVLAVKLCSARFPRAARVNPVAALRCECIGGVATRTVPTPLAARNKRC